MKRHKINPQTEQNAKRLKEFRKRLGLWVVAYGITHPAVERRFLGSDSLRNLRRRQYKPLNFKHMEEKQPHKLNVLSVLFFILGVILYLSFIYLVTT